MQHLIKKGTYICSLILFPVCLFGQSFEIHSPLEIPLFLSGNFGELRNSHFHGGIDIKTQSVTGKKVLAIADGYISKVRIETGGYGHAIFITHPNGYTSIYCHLQEFFPDLEAWVKEEQYKQKTFSIELIPEKNKYNVSAGQFIGLSGNTGRSGGPHLHLEIRDENDVPVNVLKFKLPIKDTIAPKFVQLFIYNDIDNQTFEFSEKKRLYITGRNNKYKIDKPLQVFENVAFGAEIYDYLNGSSNKCGVYSLELTMDNTPVYFMQMDKISYNEMGYIKTYSDYAEKIINNKGIYRLFVEPNNCLTFYGDIKNHGIIEIKDELTHRIKIIAKDAYGNISTLEFSIIYKKDIAHSAQNTEGKELFKFKKDNVFENDFVKFLVHENSLYSDKYFTDSIEKTDSFYTNKFVLGDELVPTNNYPLLSLKVTKPLNGIMTDKLIVVRIDREGNLISEGGLWEKNWVTAKVNGFGTYAVSADTTAPEIKPVVFRNASKYSSSSVFSFKITDDLSGIKSYNGFIDNNWVLFEYDSKSDSLFYKIDSLRLEQKSDLHELKILVSDECNNTAVFTGKFYY